MATNETLLQERSEHIVTLTLNRPQSLNGITNPMLRELHDALTRLAQDDDARVLVLTGAGRGFCPGADVRYYASDAQDEPLRNAYFEIAALLHELPLVTIAAINGACAGAGMGFAAACDLRFAARGASFNSAFLAVALSGDFAGPWTLSRILGAARARELYFLPGKFDAAEAERIGLVSRVFEDDAFRAEVGALARRIAASAPLALRAIKANFVAAETMPLRAYIPVETERHRRLGASADSREAFRAFVEKRPARFEGR